jgi:geranylgeranyl pyrophosphate synthase
MITQRADLQPPHILRQLLETQFEPDNLSRMLGPEASRLHAEYWQRALQGPLADFLQRPSKEFRANLVNAAYSLASGPGTCPVELSKLVEIIHAGSLIVDDIQDDSKERRGAPSLHVTYGVPLALNAGNWLYFWAFNVVSNLELPADKQLEIFKSLSRTVFACHYGQGLDLTARITDVPQSQVPKLVETSTRLKTGALMAFAARLGGIAANTAEHRVEALTKFGAELGVGLQMMDDVGGLLNEARWSKGAEDLMLSRPTWPWVWLASELSSGRYAELRGLAADVRDGRLRPEFLARRMQQELRSTGRQRVRLHLQRAFEELSSVFGTSEELDSIYEETQRLEKSYG